MTKPEIINKVLVFSFVMWVGGFSSKIYLMKLIDAIRPHSQTRLAIVGAGGKTTTLFRLAEQISGPVIVTTSTHLGMDQVVQADHHFMVQTRDDLTPMRKKIGEGVTLVTGGEGERKRTGGLSFELLDLLNDIAYSHNVPLLLEADGSRRRPLKAPANHEPPIPEFIDTVIVVAGFSGLGKPLTHEWVHRPERFERLTGLAIGESITPQDVVEILTHPNGGLRNIPIKARRLVFLNQVDTPEQAGMTRSMIKALQKVYDVAIIGRMLDLNDEVKSAFVRVAGVVLAAGGSTRMGTPKQLLDWDGKVFVRVAAEKALKAGLDPVLVVTGASHQMVGQAIGDLKVTQVYNPDWEMGQSTSVKAGINAISDSVGAVIFFLVDQPKVPVNFIQALLETHAMTLSPIILPMVDHKRGNPVLFDKITFKEFSNIEGDVGGRQVFSHYPLTWVPWVDSSVFTDVDTMEDYKNIFD
jgi:molybdenum cofactor cytidylyltransferase